MRLSQVTFSGGVNSISANLITLRSKSGLIAQFTNYGARWVSMWTPDKNGVLEDVVLGFDKIDKYISATEQYHGAIVGRVCGRISNSRFILNGKEYKLASNDLYGSPHHNHLHGGIKAFHNRIWKWNKCMNDNGNECVVFTYRSPDNEEGYPGELDITVVYTLKEDRLCMTISAESDQSTPVNITNHAFFNLRGVRDSRNVLSHMLMLNSSTVIECDKELIPTRRLISVKNLGIDFSSPRTISNSLLQSHSQIEEKRGFSIAFALDPKEKELTFAAQLKDDVSARKMDIYTNQSSIQVYTAYFMDGSDIGKDMNPYYESAGVALETQGYPDAVNHDSFPSIVINEGETYIHKTEYVFGVIND